MIKLRPGTERGRTKTDAIDTLHTFSFGSYVDPQYDRFRNLVALNEERIAPGQGVAQHPHQDMEIVSYVIDGELAYQDTEGNASTTRPGEVQRLSAGSGVYHSEMNPTRKSTAHFLQLWIVPDRKGLEPSYEKRAFTTDERRGKLRLVLSRDGRDRSVKLHADARMFAALLAPGDTVIHPLPTKRHAWLHVVRGALTVRDEDDEEQLAGGDAAAISGVTSIELAATEDTELVLLELA